MTIAFLLRYGIHWIPRESETILQLIVALTGTLCVWALLFYWTKLDGFRRGWNFSAIFAELCVAVSFLIVILLAVGYLLQIFVSRFLLTYFGFLLFLGFATIRYVAHSILGSKHMANAVRRVLIVGAGPVAREMASKIERHPEMMCRVVGFLYSADSSPDTRFPVVTDEATSVKTLGVIDLLREKRIDEVIITLSNGITEIMNLAARCRQEGIGVSVVPYPYELYLSKPQLIDIGGLPVLQLRETNPETSAMVWKRGVDLILGSTLLVLTAPLLVIGALTLLRKKGGPFCCERRCGRLGKTFSMWRLNSDRDAMSVSTHESALQQLSITELPQLWNVLRGEMSLVGPRPESPERVKHYSDWQRRRLGVKPGMTGLAQVHGLRQQHSSEDKARFDLQYIMQCSFFLDISLLLQTGWTLMGRLLNPPKRFHTGEDEINVVTLDHLPERNLTSAHRTQSSAD
jgi:lipopolysaccharide/colanic/teichoic acid biosynthesis glycosyltransferase